VSSTQGAEGVRIALFDEAVQEFAVGERRQAVLADQTTNVVQRGADGGHDAPPRSSRPISKILAAGGRGERFF
jgi:hypothetical protein